MFVLTPEGAKALLESWDDLVAWLREHPLFFGCSGMITWAAILISAIVWLVRHVRFV